MYTFLAVAPCSFNIAGKAYVLDAGKRLRVKKSVGERLRQPSFQYARYLRLINIDKEDLPKKEQVAKNDKVETLFKAEIKTEPKVEKAVYKPATMAEPKVEKAAYVPEVKETKATPTIIDTKEEPKKEEVKLEEPKKEEAAPKSKRRRASKKTEAEVDQD